MFSRWTDRWSLMRKDITAYQRGMLHPSERDWRDRAFKKNMSESDTENESSDNEDVTPAPDKGLDGP